MDKASRLQKIFEIVASQGSASSKYLTNVLNVSESTIRRDLVQICADSSFPVKRVHGGVLFSVEKTGLEPMFEVKLSKMIEEKKKISRIASHVVEDGDTILLDSGTTLYYFAKTLGGKRGLKTVSTDVKVAEEISRHPNIQNIITCGEVRAGYYSIGGEQCTEFLKTVNAEKAFIGTDGWTLEGSFNSSIFEVGVKRELIRHAKQSYLIADHTKFGKEAFMKVVDMRSFTAVITDSPPPVSVMKKLKKMGINVIFKEEG